MPPRPLARPLHRPLSAPRWEQGGLFADAGGGGGDPTEGGGVPATAIRQRDSAVIRDRAGNTIQVRI